MLQAMGSLHLMPWDWDRLLIREAAAVVSACRAEIAEAARRE